MTPIHDASSPTTPVGVITPEWVRKIPAVVEEADIAESMYVNGKEHMASIQDLFEESIMPKSVVELPFQCSLMLNIPYLDDNDPGFGISIFFKLWVTNYCLSIV